MATRHHLVGGRPDRPRRDLDRRSRGLQAALALSSPDPLVNAELDFLRPTLPTRLGRYSEAGAAARAYLESAAALHRAEVDQILEHLEATGHAPPHPEPR